MVMNVYLKLIEEKYFQLYGFHELTVKQKLYGCINIKHHMFQNLKSLYVYIHNY